jgi:hypothetical protein
MRRRALCIVIVVAALTGAAGEWAVGQGYGEDRYGSRSEFSNIRTFRNGNTEVVVSNACVATYDASGYRINNGRCSGDDITRADQQYADYRRFGGNRGAGPNFSNIRTFRNGNTEVVVSNACVATYDAGGYRINNGRCSGDDITRADQQYADYRRFGGNRGAGPNFGNIRTLRNGNTEVVVSNACVAVYDTGGYRINNGRCSGDDITRADQQYADYRRFGGNRGFGPN